MSLLGQIGSKEQALFRGVLKSYETKQYKKGVKQCDAILKVYPNHGDTLAMKGLLWDCMGRPKSEAYDFVRRGIRNTPTSSNCWHVLGILYRSERDHVHACEAFANALRHDPEGQQVLRDLSYEQAVRHDWRGMQQSRRRLLVAKSGIKNHWCALISSFAWNGDNSTALLLLDKFVTTLRVTPIEKAEGKIELSELLLYRVHLLRRLGRHEDALQTLADNSKDIRDRMAWAEARADALVALGRAPEAADEFRELLRRNPDSSAYLDGYLTAVGVRGNAAATLAKLDELATELKFAGLVHRRALDMCSGAEFEKRMADYLPARLRRGSPAVRSELKGLYADAAKVAVIEREAVGCLEALKASGKLAGSDVVEEPAMLESVYGFLVQHFDKLDQHARALALADEAMAKFAKSIELGMYRARVLKHLGRLREAAEQCEATRLLDTSDRYINNKCTKYLLRNGDVQKAHDAIALFARDGEGINVFDMQSMWYELESGDAFYRARDYGRALKRYTQVMEHFTDMKEDHWDFLLWCWRKSTLRALDDMMEQHGVLKAHPNFVRASTSAIQCYLELHELKSAKKPLPPALDLPVPKRTSRAKRLNKKEDTDPNGVLLAKTAAPLDEAVRLAREVCASAPNSIDAQAAAASVFRLAGKPMLAVKAALSLAGKPTGERWAVLCAEACAAVRDLKVGGKPLPAAVLAVADAAVGKLGCATEADALGKCPGSSTLASALVTLEATLVLGAKADDAVDGVVAAAAARGGPWKPKLAVKVKALLTRAGASADRIAAVLGGLA